MAEIFRTINLIVGIGVFAWLLIRRVRKPEWFEKGSLRRDIWTMAFCWDVASVVGTFEQLFNTGTYVRVAFTLAALLTTIGILFRPASDWTGEAVKRN